MNIELIKEFETISTETSCSLFKMNVTPRGKWKLYIYSSKKIFTGTLEGVMKLTIAEFKNNRISSTPKTKLQLNSRPFLKYKYVEKAKLQDTEGHRYQKRVDFAKSLGYPTIVHAVGALTSHTFICMFNKQNLIENDTRI